MPYRVDVTHPAANASETLIDLGALDIEPAGDDLAAVMPDAVSEETVRAALAPAAIRVSPAVGRDDGSVWRLVPREVRVGAFRFIPATAPAAAGAIRLVDGDAFGTGLHPTTALCLEAIETLAGDVPPGRMLDVGIGSGILALAALRLGVPHVTGLEIDPAASMVAAENARLNGVAERLTLMDGGPESVDGMWPLTHAVVTEQDGWVALTVQPSW